MRSCGNNLGYEEEEEEKEGLGLRECTAGRKKEAGGGDKDVSERVAILGVEADDDDDAIFLASVSHEKPLPHTHLDAAKEEREREGESGKVYSKNWSVKQPRIWWGERVGREGQGKEGREEGGF